MAKIRPMDGVHSMSGKVKTDGDMMFITKSRTGDTFTRVIGKRDKEQHPVTANETATHNKMHDATAAYHEIKQHPEQYQQLVQHYQEAKAQGFQQDIYRYFLHEFLDEGKNSVTLKIAKSKSNEDSYVEGMLRCQNREEADRLLVDFVEKLGYKKLAQAYKTVAGKEIIRKG